MRITYRHADTITALLAPVRDQFPSRFWPAIWVVGGAVRDLLCGRSTKDWDLVTTMTEAELLNNGFRYVAAKSTLPIYIRSTVAAGVTEIIRIDSESALRADLSRRDFTINAMALTLHGVLLDPCNGREALARNELHPCSDHIFRDDPLRLIRALRFLAEGWRFAPTTAALLARHAEEPALATLPVERYTREMLKALQAPDPAVFFRQMVAGAIGRCFVPELFRMGQVPAGPRDKHPEGDLLTHSLQTLENMAARTVDPMARFCALFHDLGKLATNPELYPRHIGHEHVGTALALQFCSRLRLPNSYGVALAGCSRLHGTAHRWGELRLPTRLDLAARARKAGITEIIPLLVAADKPGDSLMPDWDRTVAIAGMSATDLGISAAQMAPLDGQRRAALVRGRRIALMRTSSQVPGNVNDCTECCIER
jgi:tRNA nucleotidyltransferase (CCA-adding enzyme)